MSFGQTLFATPVVVILASAAWADVETPASVTTPGDSPFSLTFRGFVGSSNNAQYFNDFLDPPVPSSSFYYGASVEIGYTVPVQGPWRLGTTLRLDTQVFSEGESAPGFESPSDYSFYVIDASAFAAREITLGDRPADVTASLRYRIEDAPDVDGVGSTTFGLSATLDTDLTGYWDVSLSADLMAQDFDTGFADVDPTSVRDGTYGRIGAVFSHPIPLAFVTKGRIGLDLESYAADGANWSYSGYAVTAGVDLLLAPRLSGAFDVSYADRAYDGDFTSLGYIAAPGRDEQTVTRATFGLNYLVEPGRTLDLSVTREWQDSDDPQFTGDRTSLAVGYTVVLR